MRKHVDPTTTAFVPVVLVDDHEIWREGVKSMLACTEFEVVGEAGSSREALAVVAVTAPRIVLLDIRMPCGDGLTALTHIKGGYPSISVIMLTTHTSPTFMARAVAGGASGYLLKGLTRDELLASLRAVNDGESLLSKDDLQRSLRCVDIRTQEFGDTIDPLTPREVEVLGLLATGLNNRDIATVLFVSEGTAKTHVERIIRKLGVSDRVQAAVWAARNHMLDN